MKKVKHILGVVLLIITFIVIGIVTYIHITGGQINITVLNGMIVYLSDCLIISYLFGHFDYYIDKWYLIN
jgi:hypothetical protein